MHQKKYTSSGRRLLSLVIFLSWCCVACVPMEGHIPIDTSAALGVSKEESPHFRTDTGLSRSREALLDSGVTVSERAHSNAVSFSSRRRPALSEGTKRQRPIKGGLTEALVADVHGGEGPSVAKSAQELSDEWQADLHAGLKEISTSRAYVTELIQDKKLFETIPRYLDVLIGKQLEIIKELNMVPQNDKTIMGDFLANWLHDPKTFFELEKAFKPKSSGSNELSSFLGAHSPEELVHFELQVRKMVHNTNKRLFRMIIKLGREGLKKLAENSQVTKKLKNPDGLAEGSQASKGQLIAVNGGMKQNSQLNGHNHFASDQHINFSEEGKRLKKEENKLRKDFEDALQNKLNSKEVKSIYELVNRISNFNVRKQIEFTIEQQEALDELLEDLLAVKESPAAPKLLYGILKGAIQSTYSIMKGLPKETSVKTTNPLKLSTLWNAQSPSDLKRFASDAQTFQNKIHRHLLDLFKQYRHWHSSHSRSMDFWIDQAQAILNLEEIKKAPSKFDTSFIYQLQEAEKDFEQARLTSR
ncbi:hypothetical protein PGT21_018041 [Puccinia graminis f. sp. tritici]|uniref:Uncharacterized protein n=2 Tax=Puccinia graminis f. sp. tritici TaxID=56615 RepID=E3K197_PUCGT|nr:uncharacterized protein PGTG_04028 [Puccinia graminis f. sp. tritici CRL 75-36-700-3]EFP78072.2 hypothetical protein PGTG_04028 [Puccinia graminis f. sp. tritici CRL 75-36-700-3]KAA1112996.1 hypothetical protein PGT21_018041 [Puccinia graminis f. sp. tritici]